MTAFRPLKTWNYICNLCKTIQLLGYCIKPNKTQHIMRIIMLFWKCGCAIRFDCNGRANKKTTILFNHKLIRFLCIRSICLYIGLISVCLWDCEWWGLFTNKKQICILSCGRFAATQMPQNMKSSHICTIFANNSLTKSNVGKCRQGWPVCLGWPTRFCQLRPLTPNVKLVSGTTILLCFSGAEKWNVLCKQGPGSVETSFPSSFKYIIGT